jgi:hypothetical protein
MTLTPRAVTQAQAQGFDAGSKVGATPADAALVAMGRALLQMQ